MKQEGKGAESVGGLEEKLTFAGASDFDRVKADANRHIQWPAGGMICCYRGQQRQKKNLHHSILLAMSPVPSRLQCWIGACQQILLDIYCGQLSAHILLLAEWQVGCVSYSCHAEGTSGVCYSLWDWVYCPFGGWKTSLCFLSSQWRWSLTFMIPSSSWSRGVWV